MKNKKSSLSILNFLSYPFKGLLFITSSLGTIVYKICKYTFNGVEFLGKTNVKILKNITHIENESSNKNELDTIEDSNLNLASKKSEPVKTIINDDEDTNNLPWRKTKNSNKKGTRNNKPNKNLISDIDEYNNLFNFEPMNGDTELNEEPIDLEDENNLDLIEEIPEQEENIEMPIVTPEKKLPWWKRIGKKKKKQEEIEKIETEDSNKIEENQEEIIPEENIELDQPENIDLNLEDENNEKIEPTEQDESNNLFNFEPMDGGKELNEEPINLEDENNLDSIEEIPEQEENIEMPIVTPEKKLPWWKRIGKKKKKQEEIEKIETEDSNEIKENQEEIIPEEDNIELEEPENIDLNNEQITEPFDSQLEFESSNDTNSNDESNENVDLQENLVEKLAPEDDYLNEISDEQKARDFVDKKSKKKEEKARLKEEKRRLKEEKLREKAEKRRKRKLNNEAYVNEKVKLEKPTLKQHFATLGTGIASSIGGIGNKIRNNSFSKNRRNKRDMNRKVLLIDFEGKDAEKTENKLLYEYVAKDKNGKIVKDYFNAYSKVEVHSYLLSEGYEVYSIKTNKLIQLLHSSSNTNRTKFKNKDLIFFLTQLSTYLKAGIPLVDSLRIVSRQYKKKNYQKIFRAIIYELSVGENFSSAMEKQNNAFPKLLINMVKTAEMTGSLPEVLDDMAEYYSEAEATRKQMITAMTYPAIVFVFSIAVMIFVMVYVVPKFVQIYDAMEGIPLPQITIVILGISTFIRKYYIFLIIGIILLTIILVMLYKKVREFRTICQWLAMHLPVFSNTIIYNEVTMFTKTFSSLLAHNVPITESMEILNQITNNEIYKMLILDTITNLAKGGKISDAFQDHWAFPIPAYEMIVTGEATGELSEMMAKVSAYYQELHKNSVTRIKTFIEPVLTIFLTVGVGIILLSVILPMFNMYSAVSDLGE